MAKDPRDRKRPRRDDLREHLNRDGQPKKRMRAQHAKALAAQTGMNAYKCGTCGAFHVGRNEDQIQGDGLDRRRY